MNTDEPKQDADRVEATPPGTTAEPQQSLSLTPEERREELRRQFRERIDDHLVAVLALPGMDACMGWTFCGLVDQCDKLKQALDEASRDRKSPLAGIKESLPLLEYYLKLARQAERYANVACRIRESGATSAPRGTSHGR